MDSFPLGPWLNQGGHKSETEGMKVEWGPDERKGVGSAGGKRLKKDGSK